MFAKLMLASYCPTAEPAPRKEWISSGTWQHIRAHRAVKRNFFRLIGHKRRLWLRVVFSLWRASQPGGPQVTSGDLCQAFRVDSIVHRAAAASSLLLQRLSALAAEASKADFRGWLADKTEVVARDLHKGRLASLWQLVRRLIGKRATKGPRPVQVIKDSAGHLEQDETALAMLWRGKFADEFNHQAQLLTEEELSATLQHCYRLPPEEGQPSLQE